MTYLAIARAVITGNEINEKTPITAPLSTGGEAVTPYEKNEIDEKRSAPDAEATALGLDPSLPWVRVSTAPVAATLPPTGWEGTLPAGCGVPAVCHGLGSCPYHAASSRCWTEEPAL